MSVNLLVTGGAGFIGSAFIRYLLTQTSFTGHILNLDLLTYAGNLENLEPIQNDPRYHFVRGDICNEALVESLIKKYNIHKVVHFAAETHVDRSIVGPAPFIETNVRGTFILLEIIRRHPHVHFHHISTDEVFGSVEKGLFSENSSYHPNSPYAAAKAASDHFVRAYAHTYGISMTISNCTNNYGSYQYPEKLIPLMITHCLERKSLPVYGEGKNIRDWLYVDDHAEALWLILQKGEKNETYAIGGDCEMRNIDLLYLLIELLAKETKESPETYRKLIEYVPDRLGHDFRYAMDCSKIKKELAWKAKHDLQAGLKKTIQWYLAKADLKRASKNLVCNYPLK